MGGGRGGNFRAAKNFMKSWLVLPLRPSYNFSPANCFTWGVFFADVRFFVSSVRNNSLREYSLEVLVLVN